MQNEFKRLESLGWVIPATKSPGLFMPGFVDESRISFPSENYSGDDSNQEADGFWATERANSIARMLRTTDSKTLWEIGAGNGNAAIPLRNLGFNVFPIEPLNSGAVTLAKNNFLTFHSTLEDLKLPTDSIDVIGAFDVLEHLEKPEDLLFEIHRVLKPGGTFICSVPAYQWLFSDFDRSIGHYRRYSRKDLSSLISSVDLYCTEIKAIYGFLVLPAFLFRRLPFLLGSKSKVKNVSSSIGGSSSIINRFGKILTFVTWLERKIHWPYGLTIIAIARKL